MTGEKQTQEALDAALRPGQIVGGKYCVDKLVGKGGMAEVWAGTNERTGKRIALKVILRSFASSSDAVELFRREALAASRVNHPNVVNVFDVIDHEGMTCIVMEMLEGEPLGTYLRRKGYLGVDEAVALLLPAMRGVAAANAEGVVHRDLKPQNIFICIGSDGRLITTKVLDFGISVMREKSVDGAQVTQLLATHGTPAYMSPEHISGAPDIDERADVYGFGVLFFEALTGQLPFLGDPGPALLVRILNEAAPKITLFRPDLPPPLVAIVECAMAKSAKDRFATLNDFIRAIEDHILPPSPLPRSLTPMAGVPLFALGEQKSGVADSVVQVLHRNESSGLHEINETMALFSLPREIGGGEGDLSRRPEAPVRADEVASLRTTQVNLRPSLRGGARGLLGKRGLAAAMFVGIVFLVGWFAFPSPSQYRGRDLAPPPPAQVVPVPAQVPPTAPAQAAPLTPFTPVAAPVQAAEAPVPLPTPAVAGQVVDQDRQAKDDSKDDSHVVAPIRPRPEMQKVNPKDRRIRPAAPARMISAHEPAAQPADHRATKPAAVVPPTVPTGTTSTRTQSAAPRAGALTPDDF
jgi:serine/threonine-protein kinase